MGKEQRGKEQRGKEQRGKEPPKSVDSRPLRAVVDACVWHAAFVRDLIVHVAVAGALDPVWTPAIETEWTRSVIRRRPDIDASRIHAAAERIRRILPDGIVPTALVARRAGRGLPPLPDPDDMHVLRAAVAARAPIICTFDRRGFPSSALSPLGIEAISPDELLARVIRRPGTATAARLLEGMRRHRASLRAPPVDHSGYLGMLRSNRLPATADLAEPIERGLADP